MIQFNIPNKPRLEDYGLDMAIYQKEKARDEKTDKFLNKLVFFIGRSSLLLYIMAYLGIWFGVYLKVVTLGLFGESLLVL